MLARHLAVRQRLGVPVAHDLCGLLELHGFQIGRHGLGLGGGRLARLHRVDCLEHGRRLRPLRFRNLGEDVAVEVHGAALVFGPGEHLGDRADHAGRLIAGEHAHAAQPARLQPRQEVAPALFGFREALGAADDLAVSALVHADRHHDRHVLVGASPAALQVDAVDVDVRVFAGQRTASPFVHGLERPVVQVGDRAGGNAGAPEDLADVLDAPRRHAGQVHLDDGLLGRGLAPFVALDDSGDEPHPLELGHLERDLARRRGEAALVGALVGPGADELVGLLVEHRVE